MTSLSDAIDRLAATFGSDPRDAIRRAELALPRASAAGQSVSDFLANGGFGPEIVEAALEVKRVAGQVNVLVHAAGILVSLPYILEPDERVESVSLGAGNTGKDFDLTTDRRVAEFKFIAWRGGAEAIRQNQVFKDYLKLLRDQSGRRKQLYLTGVKEALAFLRGGRALTSVLSKDAKTKERFYADYGTQYARVGDFFTEHEGEVEVLDLRAIVPVFATTAVPDTPMETRDDDA